MNNAMKPVSIDTIEGGRLKEEINKALVEMNSDLCARPQVARPRVVEVKILLIPKLEGDLDKPILTNGIGWSIKPTLPPLEGGATIGIIEPDENGVVHNMVNVALPLDQRPQDPSLLDELGDPPGSGITTLVRKNPAPELVGLPSDDELDAANQ